MKKLTFVALLTVTSTSVLAFGSGSLEGRPFIQASLGVGLDGLSISNTEIVNKANIAIEKSNSENSGYDLFDPLGISIKNLIKDSIGEITKADLNMSKFLSDNNAKAGGIKVSPVVSLGAGYYFKRYDLRTGVNIEWLRRFNEVSIENRNFPNSFKSNTDLINTSIFVDKAFKIAKINNFDVKAVVGAKAGLSYLISNAKLSLDDKTKEEIEKYNPIDSLVNTNKLKELKQLSFLAQGAKMSILAPHFGINLGTRFEFTKNITLDLAVPVDLSVIINKENPNSTKETQKAQYDTKVLWKVGLSTGISYKF